MGARGRASKLRHGRFKRVAESRLVSLRLATPGCSRRADLQRASIATVSRRVSRGIAPRGSDDHVHASGCEYRRYGDAGCSSIPALLRAAEMLWPNLIERRLALLRDGSVRPHRASVTTFCFGVRCGDYRDTQSRRASLVVAPAEELRAAGSYRIVLRDHVIGAWQKPTRRVLRCWHDTNDAYQFQIDAFPPKRLQRYRPCVTNARAPFGILPTDLGSRAIRSIAN